MCNVKINGMRMSIVLNDFDKIKEFIELVKSFESDVNIIKGSVIFDAKSLMAIFDIDASRGADIEILSDNMEEIKRFREVMSRFKKEVVE